MASLCSCFGSRSRIQLPADGDSPPPRVTRIIEPKLPSTRESVASRRRIQRVSTSPRKSGLQSEKDALLAVETEVEEELDDDDGATHSSSTVSLPNSRITSIASTFTSSNRESYTDSELPPYSNPPAGDLPGFITAGELFRNIQRQIAVSEEREIDMSAVRSEK